MVKMVTKTGEVVKIRNPRELFNYIDKETRLSNFQVIEGGKDGGSLDWLSSLPVGTVFLCEDIHNTQNFVQQRLRVAFKYEKSVFLYENITEKPFSPVNPARFCKQFRLVQKWLPEEEETIQEV